MSYKPNEIDSIFNKIILEMISGRSLKSILKDDNMPVMNTFLKWIEEDESKMNHYARATKIRADYLFEEIIEIADEDSGDIKYNALGEEVLNGEFVQRSRLKVDARKWVVSKMNPKKYGEKLDIDHTTKGEKIESVTVFKLPDNERD